MKNTILQQAKTYLVEVFDENCWAIKQSVTNEWESVLVYNIRKNNITSIDQISKDTVRKWAKLHYIEFTR